MTDGHSKYSQHEDDLKPLSLVKLPQVVCVTYKKKWRRSGKKLLTRETTSGEKINRNSSSVEKKPKRFFFLRDKRAGHDRFNRFGEKKK